MAKQKTQWKDVLEHLRAYKHITSMEAFTMYHITRLAAVVFRLRKMGYTIITTECVGKNQYGLYRYADYTLEEVSDDDNT